MQGTFPEIARWWRRSKTGAKGSEHRDLISRFEDRLQPAPRSTDPRTLLLHVTRTQDGRDFIRDRVLSLRQRLRNAEDRQARFLLAIYLEKLGDDYLDEALMEVDKALAARFREDESRQGWIRSERARLAKACRSLHEREKALAGRQAQPLSSPVRFVDSASDTWSLKARKRPRQEIDEAAGAPPSAGPRCRPIDERNASDLSYQEFIERYALQRRPVIIKGGTSLCFDADHGWNRLLLEREAGTKMVPVRRWVSDSVSWARLEDAGQVPLARLLQPHLSPEGHQDGKGQCADTAAGMQSPVKSAGETARREFRAQGDSSEGKPVNSEPLYLHDWSIPQNLGSECSLLARAFQVPRYFAGDMLQRVAKRGLPYTDSWPSLFIGPKGSKSDTHIDSFGSHFWMALLEGKKRWLLYPNEACPLLYPIWPEGCHDPVFEACLDEPDERRHPAALLAEGFQCVLEAGDLLFVPAGCPHRVENITDTVALSGNYVDATNLSEALEALDTQALTNAGAGSLAAALRACDSSLVRRQLDVAWNRLKEWPRDDEVADWLPKAED